MPEWTNGEPPLDRDVEFERDGNIIARGRLTKTPVTMDLKSDLTGGDKQYRLADSGELFTVNRWRELE